MELTNCVIIDSCTKESVYYFYEIHIDNLLFAGMTFKFKTKLHINDSCNIEVLITDEIYKRGNLDGILTDIGRVWIVGRYLDSSGGSAMCAEVNTGKKPMRLYYKFPDRMLYIYNKRPSETYGFIELFITKKDDWDSPYHIPLGFIRI